ncbi:SDR family oxidoreductase [Gallaecimonas mangrovi]|uniref:SDR family oxidoreductase n=1 Tax=Gallaecimonas mangrovi TaxID=2291597 RepID=UPI000E1FC237|nr:SDR family oxidoreductase [Gallaecimonas mangrovi]
MQVLLIGATGGVGRLLVPMLQDSPRHQLRVIARKAEQVADFKAKGIDAVQASLEGSVDALADAMAGVDAVIFSAGSGGSTSSDKTLLVDLDGAVKAMEAAEQADVSQFLMVSAIQAHHRENWHESLLPYYAAKHYADRLLIASDLDYTIVRPGTLTNDAGTGKVKVATNITGGGTIAREDVAKVLLACLDNPQSSRQAFDLVSGDTPIADALNNL